MDENYIILKINSKDLPFYRKDIVPGLICMDKGFEIKVVEIDWDEVTLDATNHNSPFYKKEFFAWNTVISKYIRWKVLAIRKKSVTVASQNLLYGKTLFIDVEIVDIK